MKTPMSATEAYHLPIEDKSCASRNQLDYCDHTCSRSVASGSAVRGHGRHILAGQDEGRTVANELQGAFQLGKCTFTA